MRILFVMRHAGYFRNFEWIVRALDARGHAVHLGFERPWGKDEGSEGEQEVTERLAADLERVTFGYLPRRKDRWASVAFDVRQAISYLRYLRPEYAQAEKLRKRWGRRTPRLVVRLTGTRLGGSRLVLNLLDRLLRRCERAVPQGPEIDAYLASEGFDAVLATPLVDGPIQVDWLRSARAAGLPALFATTSWDNLTLKGLVFEQPDRTYVWNEIQRDEAARYHRIPPETVVVAGAHSFDHWFEWKPRDSREAFCERVGLDPATPFILYVCSSGLIASDERPLVARWLERLRSHEALRDVGVLVRPHVNGTVWLDSPLADVPNATVWPPTGSNPIHADRRHAYFDSIYHSAAVVGINTTALIEAAIVGRRTFTYVVPETHGGQEGTLHFHYLARDNGGALTVGRSLEEHAEQLAQAIAGSDEEDPWRARFLESFVRPRGIEQPGAPYVIEDIESFVAAFVPSPVTPAPRGGRLGLTVLDALFRDSPEVEAPRRTPTAKRAPARRRRLRVRKRLKHFVVVQRARARVARNLVLGNGRSDHSR